MPRLVTESGFSPASRASRPASHSAVRNAAATSTPYVGRKWNSSGYICRLPFGTQQIQQQQPTADHDRRVRYVERVPVIVANVEVQKIRHPAKRRAIEHVS